MAKPPERRYSPWWRATGPGSSCSADGLAAHTGERREVAEELLRSAGLAADRIERGIDLLVSDSDALDAFRMANSAVARALRQRLGPDEPEPRWRTFQIAFILLNLPGLADPLRSAAPDRRPSLLPHRRRQDGGLLGFGGVRHRVASAAPARRGVVGTVRASR